MQELLLYLALSLCNRLHDLVYVSEVANSTGLICSTNIKKLYRLLPSIH